MPYMIAVSLEMSDEPALMDIPSIHVHVYLLLNCLQTFCDNTDMFVQKRVFPFHILDIFSCHFPIVIP